MSLTRKRKRELKRLRSEASSLWESQQELVDHANRVAREAGRQAGNYSREQVVPAVVSAYEDRVQPVVDRGRHMAQDIVTTTRRGLATKVVPAVGSAVGAVMSIGDVANDARVRAAVERVQRRIEPPAPVKSGPSIGRIIAIGAGVLAAAGVGYAIWQTLRADDELWVAEDEPLLPNT